MQQKERADVILCSVGMTQARLSRATADHNQIYTLCCWNPAAGTPKKTAGCSSFPSALGKRMPEVFCNTFQKETFLYNQTVQVLTPSRSSRPHTPEEACSALACLGLSTWPERALQSRLAVWSMLAGPHLDAWADSEALAAQKRKKYNQAAPLSTE